ncbi:MAG TPA: HK97 family phage prohead protease [Candidatus Thermoplasmatota archaeon]|nr:HK97 family phage prohead protease [Candidatus Thermoplasmatota archaeon]
MEPTERKVFAMPLLAKQVSDEGTFDGYLTVWDEPDLYGDVIKRGAFKESLKEKGDTRPLLWQHWFDKPIGLLTAKEDDKGLLIHGDLNLSVQLAKEALSLLKQGAINGLSQGFNPMKWELDADQAGRVITQIDLWEGSLVTFPAQPLATVLSVRGAGQWSPSSLLPRVDEARAREDEAVAASIERMLRVAEETLKRLTPG